MSIPVEFTAEAVAAEAEAASSAGVELFAPFLASGEPYRSLLRHNPWLKPPRNDEALCWGEGAYYDTTVAARHPHWRQESLPRPTRALVQLRRDFVQWGYCLIEDGLSQAQCNALRARVESQAQAERQLGIAHVSAAQQHVWSLINKGDAFPKCMEHDPAAVQAGPLIERFLLDTLGPEWNHFSFLANISFPDCHPQAMHQDQSFLAPFQFEDGPALVNTIYVLQDVDDINGGTLIVPGSHRSNGKGAEAYGEIKRPINLDAPAGTIMLMDGRVLHGGAVNRSSALRSIITNSTVKPWVKQQESFLLTVAPEVLAQASDKLLHRLGFQATAVRNMVEGFGYAGSGRAADPNGALQHVRRTIAEGSHAWVRELVPNAEGPPSTLQTLQQEIETRRGRSHEALLARIEAGTQTTEEQAR